MPWPTNSAIDQKTIFRGFITWNNFDVGEQFYSKKSWKVHVYIHVKFLTFEEV